MKRKTALPRNHKRRGEWVEMKFMTRATEHAVNVSKPWGDSLPYDFVVESHGRLLRVQVKSTQYQRNRNYTCQVHPYGWDAGTAKHHRKYKRDDFDFAALYLIPEDTWYIVPMSVIARLKGSIVLSPAVPGHKYERYLEAWHLLTDPPHKRRRHGSPQRLKPR